VDERIDMLFIDRLVAMDSILQFFSFSNVDNSHPLWEYSQYVSPLEEQETKEVLILQDTSQVKAKERKCRMKNFFESRDTLLCESWLEISLDGAQSNEQHRSTYRERIHEYYSKHKTFESAHSMKSVMSRWGTILECTTKLCGCYTQIANRNQSGKNEQDRVFVAYFFLL
jgi:hypothetical protein